MDDPGSKATWRRRIREHRRARTTTPGAATARIADARTLADHVLARLGPGRDARGVPAIVAVYQSLPTEPPTTVLLHELLRRRRTVLLPVLLPDRDLSWRALGGPDPDPAATLDPCAAAAAALIIVPALAVDRVGTRLGQGGGSYDRALARVPEGIPIVALLYDDEALLGAHDELLPRQAHDRPVTAVVTPGGGWRSLTDGPRPPGHVDGPPR